MFCFKFFVFQNGEGNRLVMIIYYLEFVSFFYILEKRKGYKFYNKFNYSKLKYVKRFMAQYLRQFRGRDNIYFCSQEKDIICF